MKNEMEAKPNRGGIYQVSLLQGLLYGDYEGSVSIRSLKEKGNTGIGTFHKLNGELIMLDGEVYRAAGDGRVLPVSDEESTPFAVVAKMHSPETKTLASIPDYKALCQELDSIAQEKGVNRFHIIRIDGIFPAVNVRSVHAQNEPYQPLAEVMKRDQTFFDYENVSGTLVGVYCPPYMAGMNAVGWHLHFLSEDKTKGGHVLGVQVAAATLAWQSLDEFQIHLPPSGRFDRFDFTADQSAAVKEIETR